MIAGRYTLDREIGRGGMGAVWLGRDEVLGRVVAMKKIGLAPVGGTPDLDRAEREARLAARLNHPKVVAVFDLVKSQDERWLVMEYVEGATLAGLVRDHGPLTPDAAAPVLAQAADALAAAHGAGIIHRDVKPSNMLVGADGSVKLSDFGIARAQADAALTQTGLVTGSPAYLAPEVASGRPATSASDVWSLGASLYHALAGQPPYDVGENLVGALYRIVHEDPPRPENAGWLAPLLASTMTPVPEDRWSAAQVRDFLEAGPGAVHRFAPVVAPARGTDRQRTSTVPSVPAVGAAAGAASAGGSRRRRRRVPIVGILAAVTLVAVLTVAGFLLGFGGDDDGGGSAGETSPSAAPTSAGTEPTGPTEDGMRSFVEEYHSTVLRDKGAGFRMLTPEYGVESDGIQGYASFWRRVEAIEDLRIKDVDVDALTVDFSYTRVQDGEQIDEDVTFRLVYEDGQYLIADAVTD